MAKKKDTTEDSGNLLTDFIAARNKRSTDGTKAYFLGDEDDPTTIKDWISTGSHLLDIAISNRPHGGLPMGRIVEFSGEEGTGKSLFCAHIMKNAIDKGGCAYYIDTEGGATPTFWKSFGLDPKKVVNIHLDSLEKVFNEVEGAIAWFNGLNVDIPLVIVVDSIAGVATELELEEGYGKEGYGTGKALILSKAMRKITNSLFNHNVLLVLTNQVRQKMNAMPFSDPWVTPGGKAIPFHSSVRVRLKSAGQIKDKSTGAVIGVHCAAKVIKNRMGPPNKVVEEDIYYDSGVNAYASWLATLKKFSIIKQSGAYYKYTKNNGEEWQFQSKDFVSTILSDTKLKDELYNKLCDAMIMKYKSPETITVEETTIEEDLPEEKEEETKSEET